MSDLNLKYKTNLYSEWIWIRVNSFDKIPNNICSLINLSEVEKFTKLMVIDCSFNKLKYLPEFEKLTNLMAINCIHNKLTYLPKWTNLINLNTICFHFNEVVIPPEFNKFKNYYL
jgi:Leucine-rich repeat (LRR) protein